MSAQSLNIIEVIENLTTLVDAESLYEIEVTPDERLIAHTEDEVREIYWVPAGPDDQTFNAVKHTFRSVHRYLQNSFNKVKEGQDPKRFIEGMGTIMVLVGEAAQKLEKLGLVFKERISDIPEYKELQEFYNNVILKGTYTRLAKDLALREKKERLKEKEEGIEESAGIHLLNNIDLIKGDFLYELFYLKNEEGHHFYTRDLARNIKLACDFGEFTKEYSGDDPLLQIKNWEDKELQQLSVKMLTETRGVMRKFYKESMLYRKVPYISLLQQALMALMLASNRRNLIRQFSLKGCHRYFSDFQHFLRQILQDREYQRELLYPSQETIYHHATELVRKLCYLLFIHEKENQEIKEGIVQLSGLRTVPTDSSLSELLQTAYTHLEESVAHHPSGPLFKTLDLIREEEVPLFDPLMQLNLPASEARISQGKREMILLRLPCPTAQEVISKAYIVDEFKEYLRAALYTGEGYHHVIINFQDRTSWKEHARTVALEEFGLQAEFADLITIVTLNREGDFYHQTGPYESLSGAEDFIAQCIEHLTDESTGYYFPKEIREKLFPDFIKSLLSQIHHTFFHRQDLLSKQDRCNFIEIVHAFIAYKLMEDRDCSTISLTSKDGLDISGTASIALLALLSSGKKWSLGEKEQLLTILFGQTLMVRERIVHKERFVRLLSFVELLEKQKGYLDSFKSLVKPMEVKLI